MPNFKYKVMNKSGQKLEGTYAAESKTQVIDMIKSNNYYPLMVEELNESKNIELHMFQKVKTKDIAIFCRQFYTMLNAGATMSNCLSILGQQVINKKLRKGVIIVDDDIRKGLTLSEAMKKQKEIFPDLFVSMVESGETSGNLDTIMERMSQHYEKENKINNKVKGAMIYPIILGIVAVGSVGIIVTFIMPTFIDMFKSSGAQLPAPTKILLGISDAIKTKWYLIILIIFAIIFGFKTYFKTEPGQLLMNKLKLKIPVVKGLNEKIIVSRFTRTLSTVLASGITLIEGLQIVSTVLGNKIVENKILEVKEQVMKGVGLSEPLKNTGVFPPMLYAMVKIGEETGALDDILNKTADFYDDELETAIQQFTTIIEPAMILVMGVVIGFIVISIMMPMFTMFNTIK